MDTPKMQARRWGQGRQAFLARRQTIADALNQYLSIREVWEAEKEAVGISYDQFRKHVSRYIFNDSGHVQKSRISNRSPRPSVAKIIRADSQAIPPAPAPISPKPPFHHDSSVTNEDSQWLMGTPKPTDPASKSSLLLSTKTFPPKKPFHHNPIANREHLIGSIPTRSEEKK